MKRLIAAFKNSIAGLRHGFVHEKAIREEIILFLISLPVAPFIAKDAWHLILLWSVILLILIAELLNTGIESQKISPKKSNSPKIAARQQCLSQASLPPPYGDFHFGNGGWVSVRKLTASRDF